MTAPTTSIIDGRYQVLARLGAPGTSQGETYKVLDLHTREVVALKLLVGANLGPWHEAQVLTHLRDDHILPIRNADVASGVPYVVTELAMNGTVQDRIDAAPAGRLDIDMAVRWTLRACVAATRAHAAGLLHTDIKPANLFLDANDNVLLGDFGLASLLDSHGLGHLSGTPATMAPEVAAAIVAGRARGTSILSDVFSIAATSYHMLTGIPAYEVSPGVGGGWPGELAVHRARRLRDLAPHVPRVLYDRIERAMSFNPAARQADPAALAADLGRARLPRRRWRQTNEHSGHRGCWRGHEPGKAEIVVCAVPNGKRFDVTAMKLPSGNRITAASGQATPGTLHTVVRQVIQAAT